MGMGLNGRWSKKSLADRDACQFITCRTVWGTGAPGRSRAGHSLGGCAGRSSTRRSEIMFDRSGISGSLRVISASDRPDDSQEFQLKGELMTILAVSTGPTKITFTIPVDLEPAAIARTLGRMLQAIK